MRSTSIGGNKFEEASAILAEALSKFLERHQRFIFKVEAY
jgi:hypothetical protein